MEIDKDYKHTKDARSVSKTISLGAREAISSASIIEGVTQRVAYFRQAEFSRPSVIAAKLGGGGRDTISKPLNTRFR